MDKWSDMAGFYTLGFTLFCFTMVIIFLAAVIVAVQFVPEIWSIAVKIHDWRLSI